MFDRDDDRGRGGQGRDRDRDRDRDDSLMTEKIFSDRKTFFLDLKENDRGRFLKITEDVRGRRDTIMVPIDCIDDFYEALGRILDYERDLDERD
jgi:hypothetical protein